MSPRRPTPDPLDQARALANEAQRAARDDWKRALLSSARFRLEDARAGLADSEEVLHHYPSPIASMMRSAVDARRLAIEQLATQIARLDSET